MSGQASDAAVSSNDKLRSFPPTSAVPSAASRYIQASSVEEAQKKLSALKAGTITASSVNFGPCTLYPSVIHLRKSSNFGAVGVKPYTYCSVPVASIHHTTDLRYKSFIWWALAGTYRGGNYGEAAYLQRKVEYPCVSSETTWWGATTLGKIVYGGETYYARVYPPREQLNCGG